MARDFLQSLLCILATEKKTTTTTSTATGTANRTTTSVAQSKIHENSLNDWNSGGSTTSTASTVVAESHCLLSRTLRDMGWNRHAVYHAAMAWMMCDHNSDPSAVAALVGDYAQLTEFAGFPLVGVVSLLVWNKLHHGNSTNGGGGDDNGSQQQHQHQHQLPTQTLSERNSSCTTVSSSSSSATFMTVPQAMDWLGQSKPPEDARDCGCGHKNACGRMACFVPPVVMAEAPAILKSLQDYLCRNVPNADDSGVQSSSSGTVSSSVWGNAKPECLSADTAVPIMLGTRAHDILGQLAENGKLLDDDDVPSELRFWEICYRDRLDCVEQGHGNTTAKNRDSDDSPSILLDVLQLLWIKLCYTIVPSLAMRAVIHWQPSKHQQQRLATEYKSHWAYYIFIRAVALGQRIKLGRRRSVEYYHVAVWDCFYGHDRRWDFHFTDTTKEKINIVENGGCNQNNSISVCSYRDDIRSKMQKELLTAMQPCTTNGPTLVWTVPFSYQQHTGRQLWVVGDSHVLSLAWQTIRLPQRRSQTPDECTQKTSLCNYYLIVPGLVTGLKAWHCRSETRFFTRTHLITLLRRLPLHTRTVVISAGEIDCREGLGGPLLAGYQESCLEHVEATVHEYLHALHSLLVPSSEDQTHDADNGNNDTPCGRPAWSLQQILIMPVAPHAAKAKGRRAGQASRRQTTQVWNQTLRANVSRYPGLYFLDYVHHLLVVSDPGETDRGKNSIVGGEGSYVLKPALDADSTHMTAAFCRHFEEAIVTSGCDLDLL